MSSLRNKVNLIGRLGAKPEIQKVNGFVLTRFRVATNETFKSKSGEWKTDTQWHSVVIWGKPAERFVKMADKGFEVAIEGKLINKQYESKAGEKRFSTDIEASDFLLLTAKVV